MVADSPTVLIVDDEEDVVTIYELALSDDYEVLTSYGGEAALETVDESVDVVLLDRRMPGLSGHEVLDELRKRELDVRVAMVTAVDPDFDIAEMDFDAYLTKPVDNDELREVVEELLALSEYDDRAKALFSLAEKQATLEAEKTEPELADSDEYAALQQETAELKARAADQVDQMDAELFEKALSGFADDTTEE